jgi:hypothetical protein
MVCGVIPYPHPLLHKDRWSLRYGNGFIQKSLKILYRVSTRYILAFFTMCNWLIIRGPQISPDFPELVTYNLGPNLLVIFVICYINYKLGYILMKCDAVFRNVTTGPHSK